MRHLILTLVLAPLLAGPLFMATAFAQDGGSFTGLGPGAIGNTDGSRIEAQPPTPCVDFNCRFFAVTTAHGFLYGLVNAIIGFVGIALLAAYFYAAGLWLTSLGDSAKITEAKKILLEATIGVVVVVLSYFVVATVITMRT